nr:MAG TPA: hypothetical protein [Caudoviricetes sp.]
MLKDLLHYLAKMKKYSPVKGRVFFFDFIKT